MPSDRETGPRKAAQRRRADGSPRPESGPSTCKVCAVVHPQVDRTSVMLTTSNHVADGLRSRRINDKVPSLHFVFVDQAVAVVVETRHTIGVSWPDLCIGVVAVGAARNCGRLAVEILVGIVAVTVLIDTVVPGLHIAGKAPASPSSQSSDTSNPSSSASRCCHRSSGQHRRTGSRSRQGQCRVLIIAVFAATG